MKDYYNILGINNNASEEDIKRAYRKLSKEFHPDINPDGGDRFKEIAEAYDVLTDPQKKQKWEMEKNGGFNGFGGFDDFFDQMFNRGNRQPQVPDKVINVNIGVIDSYRGKTVEIKYQRNIECSSCNSSGGDTETCGTCQGQGFFVQTIGGGFFQQTIRQTCPSCGGRGKIVIRPCSSCSGRSVKQEIKTIKFEIPVGIDSGQFIRMTNLGDFSNGVYGNLLIKVDIVEQDGFIMSGIDLIYRKEFDLESLSYDKFTIPHPDGELSITMPETFDTTKPLRVKNKGFKSHGIGDLYVDCVVKFKREK
jgi:molecular chaperone DnaJ